jgi:hypothetical protein
VAVNVFNLYLVSLSFLKVCLSLVCWVSHSRWAIVDFGFVGTFFLAAITFIHTTSHGANSKAGTQMQTAAAIMTQSSGDDGADGNDGNDSNEDEAEAENATQTENMSTSTQPSR